MNMRVDPDDHRPRTTLPASYDIFDFARWKPISADRLVDELAYIFGANGEYAPTIHTLVLPDGRVRIAYVCPVVHYPSNEEADEPYIVIHHDPEARGRRPTIFIRSDVGLAEDDAD